MNRRRFLSAGATAAAVAGLAGCTSDDSEDDPTTSDDMPRVQNPPDGVYLPSHTDGMAMLDTEIVGEVAVSPMLSIPHFFWIVETGIGDGVERVDPPESDSVHFMASVWDPETDVVLPVDAGLSIDIEQDGRLVDSRAPWAMLSQGMGFHFGDNYDLDGNGQYTATITTGSMENVRLTGEMEGRFQRSETVTVEFEMTNERRQRLVESVQRFEEERWGSRAAVPPMNRGQGGMGEGEMQDGDERGMQDGDERGMQDGDERGMQDGDERGMQDGDERGMQDGDERGMQDGDERGMQDGDSGENGEHLDGGHQMPYSSLPDPETLPGTLLGTPTFDDAVYATTLLEPGSRFVEGEEQYLAVSPRTPYNRCVLPQMSLSATLERDGEVLDISGLQPTLDHELEFHYGATVDDIQVGDELVLAIDSVSQAARHQGYETAFTETGERQLAIDTL
ncbi:hypothetical protein ACFQH2_10265 [Natronoarchaeum sp. GCM10025703]|uniref:DUF7350 domain-containing protein n=1 Tax=unclassified Natronoarchaeum TaxID=2620183 RepID=UPI003607793A